MVKARLTTNLRQHLQAAGILDVVFVHDGLPELAARFAELWPSVVLASHSSSSVRR